MTHPVFARVTQPRRRERFEGWSPAIARMATSEAALGLGGVLCVALTWELLPRVGVVDRRFLPPLSSILDALADRLGTDTFWTALMDTVITWATGLFVALVAGVVLGVIIGMVPLLRAATASTIEFLRPIPSVALIPLAVLFYGTQREATLLLVIYASFWQVLVQVLYGVQDIDPVARDTAHVYRFSSVTKARCLVWPTALPYVLTGFRLAATVALILTVTGELIIGTPGIGKLLAVAQSSGAVPSVYALVIVTGVMGVLVNLMARALERRILRWHPSVRRERAS